MIRNTIFQIFDKTWPSIIISMVIIISMRTIYLLKNKKQIILYKELLNLLFIIYVLCLFNVVTTEDVSFGISNLTPFNEMFRYNIGSKLFIKNVLGNIILFMPYGFFNAYYLKLKSPYTILGLSFLVSITIESTQLLIGRVFDIDDIILNIIGGIIGFYIYHTLIKINSYLPPLLKKPIIYNIIMIGLLALVLTYLTVIIEMGVWNEQFWNI